MVNKNTPQQRLKDTATREPRTRRASELKDIVRALPHFTEDELQQIPVVRAGSRLKSGATYLDLRAPRGREFSAPVEAYVGRDACYVAKSDVAPPLWDRLLRVPSRGTSDERAADSQPMQRR